MELGQYQQGQTILVPTEADGYCAMVVVESRGFSTNQSVRASPLGAPASAARALESDEIAGIMEADKLALDGTPDVVKVAKLSEASLLHNLRVRYGRDDIYTRAGSILISVNPFKTLNIYGADRMAQAKVRARAARHFFICSRRRSRQEFCGRLTSSRAPLLALVSPSLALQDADAKTLQELPPHVYALAEAAFRGMLVEQKQQVTP